MSRDDADMRAMGFRNEADVAQFTRSVTQITEQEQRLTNTLRLTTEALRSVTEERDQYQRAADDMAMAHKVERDALRAGIERLDVQLAGCGVAALGNTEASKLQRAKPKDYGYSESYAEVCRAVDREIAQRNVLKQALEAMHQYTTNKLTVGQRYTNEGQQLLDAITAIQEQLHEHN